VSGLIAGDGTWEVGHPAGCLSLSLYYCMLAR
jgi:hypothetical protein